MAQFQRHFVQDLTKPLIVRQCGDLGFSGDNLSDVISVDLYTDGVAYSGGGTCAGACICPDGSTVALSGSLSGKTASVTLKEDCFAIPGQIGIAIRVTSGTTKTTVLKAIYNVEPFSTSNPVDPGSRIALDVGDLINRIDTAVESIPASADQLKAAMAPNFSATTAYPAGAYVWYNGTLYRFTTAHAAGSWAGTDAETVVIGNNVANSTSAFAQQRRSGISYLRGGYYASGLKAEPSNDAVSTGMITGGAVVTVTGTSYRILLYNNGNYIGKINSNYGVDTAGGSWYNFTGTTDLYKLLAEKQADAFALVILANGTDAPTEGTYQAWGESHCSMFTGAIYGIGDIRNRFDDLAPKAYLRKGVLNSSNDIDSVGVPGFYRVYGNSAPTNWPITGGGNLLVTRGDYSDTVIGGICQIIWGNHETLVRFSGEGTWTDWQIYYDDDSSPTVNAISASLATVSTTADKLDDIIINNNFTYEYGGYYATGSKGDAVAVRTDPIYAPAVVDISGNASAHVFLYKNGVFIGKVAADKSLNTTAGDWYSFIGVHDIGLLMQIYDADAFAISVLPSGSDVPTQSTAQAWGEAHVSVNSGLLWYTKNLAQDVTQLFGADDGLKKRIYDNSRRISDLEGGLPDYWKTNIDSVVNTVNTRASGLTNGDQYIFITDLHVNAGNSNRFGDIIDYILANTSINKVICGGDMFTGADGLTGRDAIGFLRESCTALSRNPVARYYYVVGNHDRGVVYGTEDDAATNTISETQLYNVCGMLNTQGVTYDVTNRFRYYFDDDVSKLRYIVAAPSMPATIDDGSYANSLNANNGWVAKSLETLPSGYNAVLLTHIVWLNYGDSYDYASMTPWNQQLCDIITAYNGKTSVVCNGITYNFTQATGGKVVLYHGGHTHVDSSYIYNSINIVTTTCDSYEQQQPYGQTNRTLGNATENAIDVVTVDIGNNKIYADRIGWGSARTFTIS